MYITVSEVTLDTPGVSDVVQLHLAGMHGNSPAGHVFAFDDAALRAPGITLFGAYLEGQLAGIGALHRLSGGQAEVKSMRTLPKFTRRGVGAAVLERIIEYAKIAGARRLSLETGSGAPFEAAIQLYLRRGFEPGSAFGDYTASDFNRFFHLQLD